MPTPPRSPPSCAPPPRRRSPSPRASSARCLRCRARLRPQALTAASTKAASRTQERGERGVEWGGIAMWVAGPWERCAGVGRLRDPSPRNQTRTQVPRAPEGDVMLPSPSSFPSSPPLSLDPPRWAPPPRQWLSRPSTSADSPPPWPSNPPAWTGRRAAAAPCLPLRARTRALLAAEWDTCLCVAQFRPLARRELGAQGDGRSRPSLVGDTPAPILTPALLSCRQDRGEACLHALPQNPHTQGRHTSRHCSAFLLFRGSLLWHCCLCCRVLPLPPPYVPRTPCPQGGALGVRLVQSCRGGP